MAQSLANRKFCYFINGGQFGVLEQTTDGYWDSPVSALTDGIMFHYSKEQSAVTEGANIDVDRNIMLAIVHYLQHKLAEGVDKRASQYHLAKFHERVRKNANRKAGPVRKIIPKGITAL